MMSSPGKNISTIFACALVLSMAASAAFCDEPVRVTTRSGAGEALIGDPFHYFVEAEGEPSFELLDAEPAEALGSFEILGRKVSDPEKAGDRVRRVWDFEMAGYDLGEKEIPAFTVRYKKPDGEIASVESRPFPLTVKPVPASGSDGEGVRPVKDPKDIEPRPYLRNFIIALIILLVIAALVAEHLWRKRLRKKSEKPAAPKIEKPIDQLALEALDELERSPLLSQGRIKEYYTRGSEIVRVFLGRRYGVDSERMTSFELLRELKGALPARPVFNRLEDFLARCDMVKFARLRPPEPEHGMTIDDARFIVTSCAPKPEPEGPVAGVSQNGEPEPYDSKAPEKRPVGAGASAEKGGDES